SGSSPALRPGQRRQRLAALGGGARLGVELQPEPVGEPGEVVEDADDVGDLEAALVAESEVAERLPVALDHPRWRGAQLLGDLAQSALPIGERRDLAPPALLDRLGQLAVTVLRTEELCMRLRSIDAVLRRGRDRGDQLPFLVRERAVAEHDLEEQRAELHADARVRPDEPFHVHLDAVVPEPGGISWRQLDPRLFHALTLANAGAPERRDAGAHGAEPSGLRRPAPCDGNSGRDPRSGARRPAEKIGVVTEADDTR